MLFVDDEPRILSGLRNRLRRQRHVWDMHFVSSPADAIELLAEAEFEVIVTDMRMPKMDGAQLLAHVHERHPAMVRFVLSGHSEPEAITRATQYAHQFLAKPCNADHLVSSVERACKLQLLVRSKELRRITGDVTKLPSMPQIYTELSRLLSNENARVDDVAAVLQQDPSMCAKVMQLVNSAFVGLGRRMTSIRHAVVYLGLGHVKNLTLVAGVFDGGKPVPLLDTHKMQQHALITAKVASHMFTDKEMANEAFLAGMLHDIGTLVLASRCERTYADLCSEHAATGESMHAIEMRTCDASHAEIGGYLLGLWGLPSAVAEAVAHHHRAPDVGEQALTSAGSVYLAQAILTALEGDLPLAEEAQAYAERVAVADTVERWRRHAQRLLEEQES